MKFIKSEKDDKKKAEELEKNKLIIEAEKKRIAASSNNPESVENDSAFPLQLPNKSNFFDKKSGTLRIPNKLKLKAELPYSIPESWLTPKEAETLGYNFEPHVKKTLIYIDTNESMFNYSTSNIGYEQL